jgi:Zn finger protein HypA/HybF involved in hydrogenase expression
MLSETIAGLGAVKTAFDLAKALKDMDNAAARNAAVIELQEKILTAQQAQAALVERIGELEKEVADFEKWEADKENYDLKLVYEDTFAYARKPIAGTTTPPHFICASCYEHRKKSILQRADSAHVFCPECKTKIRFDSVAAKSFNRPINPVGRSP